MITEDMATALISIGLLIIMIIFACQGNVCAVIVASTCYVVTRFTDVIDTHFPDSRNK